MTAPAEPQAPPAPDVIADLTNTSCQDHLAEAEKHWQRIRELEAEIAKNNLEIERLEAEIAEKKKALARQEARSQHRQKRRPGLIGRNDSCPCASGKKFKTCCMKKHQRPAAV